MSTKPVDVGLAQALEAQGDPSRRVLAVRCLGAIGDLRDLLEALVDERNPEVRQAAIETLRHWIGLHKDNELILHDFLIQKDYRPREADSVLGLLHSFPRTALGRPETYARLIDLLHQDKSAIRDLAYWHLSRLVPQGNDPSFDPHGDSGQVERAYRAWKKLIPEGSLPPQPTKSGPKPEPKPPR